MPSRDKILSLAKKKGILSSNDVVQALAISRQTAAHQLNRLVQNGFLIKTGSTKSARYSLVKGKALIPGPETISLVKKLKGLEEDKVSDEVELRLGLKHKLSSNTLKIFRYAFTELLNNAIDHSRSSDGYISISLSSKDLSFKIRDKGIGIFFNVQKTFSLKTEIEALEHLFKGRQTTDPARHSGQGIFFTSRIADKLFIRSHLLETSKDNTKDDLFIKDIRSLKGTEVEFQINRKSRRSLKELFEEYSDENFEFAKDTVSVKLSALTGTLSRSEARRLLFGLEKFKQLTFDFKGVKEIGQSFADEIFRVFPKKNPQIAVSFANASPSVSFMIGRAMRG